MGKNISNGKTKCGFYSSFLERRCTKSFKTRYGLYRHLIGKHGYDKERASKCANSRQF